MAIVAVSQLVLLLTLGTLGVRLLWLARRTGKAPELFLGLAFVCVAVGLPLLVVSGLSRGPVSGLQMPLLALALVFMCGAMASFPLFARSAFRAHSTGALVGALGVGALSLTMAAGGFVTLMGAPSDAHSGDAAWGWFMGVRLVPSITYLWMAIEGFHHYGEARKRLALGLTDPLVANRFLLWGAVSLFGLVNSSLGAVLQAQGLSITNSAAGAALSAFTALGTSAIYGLVFLPPDRYRDWVVARAAREST